MRRHPTSPSRVTEIRLPTSSGADNITYRQCPGDEGPAKECTTTIYPCFGCTGQSYTIQNFVISATVDGDTWTYGLVYPNQYIMIRDSDTPTGLTRVARAEPPGPLDLFGSEDGNFNLSGNQQNRLLSYASPEGWSAAYTYDTRGNVTETKFTPSGTTDPITYERAGYATTCPAAERRRCNQPNWLEDRNGNRTDFTYSIDHGGVLTATGPAVNGVMRQVRYEYQQRYARFLNGSGTVVQAAMPVWLLVRERMCRTGAPATPPATGCAIAGDEMVTEYDYGPTTVVNNLLLRGSSRTRSASP